MGLREGIAGAAVLQAAMVQAAALKGLEGLAAPRPPRPPVSYVLVTDHPLDCEDPQSNWHLASFFTGVILGILTVFFATIAPIAWSRRQRIPSLTNVWFGSLRPATQSSTEDSTPVSSEDAVGSEQAIRLPSGNRTPCASHPAGAPEKEAHPYSPQARRDFTEEVESMHLFRPRTTFLVVMLLIQSVSSLILSGFEDLINKHSDLVYLLTMIVGLGGNAGGQSVVLAVRGMAIGKEAQVHVGQQFLRSVMLSMVIVPVTFVRALASGSDLLVCLAVGLSCLVILVASMSCGTALPRILLAVKIDPAHGAAMIQVLMDISGIAIVCLISLVLLPP